jgi:hypothetical protein
MAFASASPGAALPRAAVAKGPIGHHASLPFPGALAWLSGSIRAPANLIGSAVFP